MKKANNENNESDKSVSQPASDHTILPPQLKLGLESLSGYTMDGVRIHRNAGRPAQLEAYDHALGTDMQLRASQDKHPPHEAWHLVKQKQGRVKPVASPKQYISANDNNDLEQAADSMGENADRPRNY